MVAVTYTAVYRLAECLASMPTGRGVRGEQLSSGQWPVPPAARVCANELYVALGHWPGRARARAKSISNSRAIFWRGIRRCERAINVYRALP
jgi:hypothetical protein